MPLLDHDIPDVPSKSRPPWLVTPLAEPLQPALRDKSLEEVVMRCLELAEN
jgi:hypothetical protein